MSHAVTCNFCNLTVDRARLSAHYRRQHKVGDLIVTPTTVHVEEVEHNVINLPANRTVGREIARIRTLARATPITQPETPKPECIMCMEPHETKLLPCNHDSSCSSCLLRWWKESYRTPRCPMCRTDVENIRKGRRNNNRVLRQWNSWRENSIRRSNRRSNRLQLNWPRLVARLAASM
jgi:hypothetical protein